MLLFLPNICISFAHLILMFDTNMKGSLRNYMRIYSHIKYNGIKKIGYHKFKDPKSYPIPTIFFIPLYIPAFSGDINLFICFNIFPMVE